MRKVNRRISWDLDERLKSIAKDLHLTVDSTIRYLVEFREKIHQNDLESKIELSVKKDELKNKNI